MSADPGKTTIAPTEVDRIREAEAQGYKRETCPKCGIVLEAYIHFIRCHETPCAMSDGKSLLDLWAEGV